MLKLLLSEFNYQKTSLFIVWGLIIIINIFFTISGDWNLYLTSGKSSVIIGGIFTIYYLIFVQSRIQISHSNNPHRFILYRTLPVSTIEISIFRLIYLLVMWIVALIILSFFYLINSYKIISPEWLKIIGFMSVIYIFFLIGLIIGDDSAKLYLNGLIKKILFFTRIFIYLTIFLINYFFIMKIELNINNLPNLIKPIISQCLLSENGIILNLTLGFIFLIFSVFTYNKRKTYL